MFIIAKLARKESQNKAQYISLTNILNFPTISTQFDNY